MNTGDGGRFGRYELRGVLGHGGFAEVYRAFDPALGREVALKALLPELAASPELRVRFSNEARSLARLQHPNIVRVFDIGEAEGRPFFAMELIEGSTLAGLAPAGRMLPLGEVVRIAGSLASALDYIHAAGLVHRDIKAANVMLEPRGRVVLMDFGVARSLDQARQTLTGASIGTPEAMAPEQVRGLAVGPAADVYALGILVYRLLAGRAPFVGDTAYLLHAQVYEAPPPLQSLRGNLPAAVYRALDVALAKEPGARPRSAGDFAKLLGGDPTVAIPVVPPIRHPSARGPLLIGAGIALAVVLALAGGLALANRGGQPATHAATSTAGQPSAGSVAAAATKPPQPTPPPTLAPTLAAPTPQPAPTIASLVKTADPTQSPRTAAPPPVASPIYPPAGEYYVVEGLGQDRCLNARANPGTTSQIYSCVVQDFVVRVDSAEGVRSADGAEWVHADGLGWMDDQFLHRIPQPAAAYPLDGACLTFRLTTRIPGSDPAPTSVGGRVPPGGGIQFTTTDGALEVWQFGSLLEARYATNTGGRSASGTILLPSTSGLPGPNGYTGQFVDTAFDPNAHGSWGQVTGFIDKCN